MMYSINARVSFQNSDMTVDQTAVSLSLGVRCGHRLIRLQGGQVFGMASRNHPTQIQVAVETETYIQVSLFLRYPK